jgi:uncharacterized protein YjiS (DUF1127 family)
MYRPIAITVIATSTVGAKAAAPAVVSAGTPSLFARMRHAFAVRRQRRALSALDARQRNDIGVSKTQASHEAARGLFDVPAQKV